MLDRLGEHIDQLINSNINMLYALLYRIDVDETEIKKALEDADFETTAGQVIARLIVARQHQKLEFRQKYKP